MFFLSVSHEKKKSIKAEEAKTIIDSKWARATSHQSGTAGSSADGGGHGADGADGGAAGAVGQRRHAHGHPLALLGLGRAGGGEADADHLVDGRKQAELGETLEVSADSRGRQRGGNQMTEACGVWGGCFSPAG